MNLTPASGFMWTQRKAILPFATIGAPLAVELFTFFYKVYKNPEIFKAHARQIKSSINNTFHKHDHETSKAFGIRQVKNAVIGSGIFVMIAIATALPFFILPTSFAIPAALLAIKSSITFFTNFPKLQRLSEKAKNFVLDGFKQKDNESLEDFKARRGEVVKRIICCSVLFSAALAGICISSQVMTLLSKSSSIWAMIDILPHQTPAVVTAEYLAIGLMHLGLVLKAFKEKDVKSCLYHFSCAALAVIFPVFYAGQPSTMRLHHSFTGLLLQLAPWRPVKCLGAAITLDSSLYMFYHNHGNGEMFKPGKFHSYDMMNNIYGNLPFVLNALISLCALQEGLDRLTQNFDLTSTQTEISEKNTNFI